MTSTPSNTSGWVSVEGINGVGKTHLARQAAQHLGGACHLLAELPDAPAATLPRQVIAALQANAKGDGLLRTGHPRTETLLLLALQVHRHEHLDTPAGGQMVVLEDRGPHSVAVYQAAILADAAGSASLAAMLESAQRLLGLIARWRPLPARTVLLVDDPDRCLTRFQQRLGRQITPSEQTLLHSIQQLYVRLAATHPKEFVVVDRRGCDEHAAVAAIVAACAATLPVPPGKEQPPCPPTLQPAKP